MDIAWLSNNIEEEEYNSFKGALAGKMQELQGCPLYFAHYDEGAGLLITPIVSWDFSDSSIMQNPQFSLLTQEQLAALFDVVLRQDHQIKILRENHRMVVKTIRLNEDRRGIKCNAEMFYLRDFTLDYKMNPKPIQNYLERFQRNLNGQSQDEYPHDLLDDKILEAIRMIYPHADVHNSLLVTNTDYRGLLRYRNYQRDYAEFRFLPDISEIPTVLYPKIGSLEGARFSFDIFMLLRPDKNAFANEGFELRFPLQGWFDTLTLLVRELNTMHKVSDLIK